MHQILVEAKRSHPDELIKSLPALLGFSSEEIVQLVCFHDFKSDGEIKVFIHSFEEFKPLLSLADILPFADTSSVDIRMGELVLQIRVKPMNKFTTTAIKLNCSVKFKQI
jgi:proteasome lid subunit RPN8/RPN11